MMKDYNLMGLIKRIQGKNYEGEAERNLLWEALFKECNSAIKAVMNKRRAYIEEYWSEEDFIQEVYFAIVKNLDKYEDSKGKFYNWVYTIAINICNNHYSQRPPVNIVSMYCEEDEGIDNIIDAFHHTDGIDKSWLHEVAWSELRHKVDELPANYRNAIIYEWNGLSAMQTAKELNCKVEDIYNYRFRAHKKLVEYIESKDMLGDLEYDPAV